MALLARLRPLALLLALAPLGSLTLTACAPRLAPTLTRTGEVRLRHRAPSGCLVSVVGDFNHWQPGHDLMRPLGDGRYEALLALPPGTYVYAFAEEFASGEVRVVAPEEAPAYLEDDLGGRSGVLSIPVTSPERARP